MTSATATGRPVGTSPLWQSAPTMKEGRSSPSCGPKTTERGQRISAIRTHSREQRPYRGEAQGHRQAALRPAGQALPGEPDAWRSLRDVLPRRGLGLRPDGSNPWRHVKRYKLKRNQTLRIGCYDQIVDMRADPSVGRTWTDWGTFERARTPPRQRDLRGYRRPALASRCRTVAVVAAADPGQIRFAVKQILARHAR